jgi:hypothetical protein
MAWLRNHLARCLAIMKQQPTPSDLDTEKPKYYSTCNLIYIASYNSLALSIIIIIIIINTRINDHSVTY